ncbi:MAG: ferredoxin [Salinisphaeraceae bacterium]|jgi:3-phenylpropionate/trans-cinnamate dioxygenase ferredoxin subunit|nr:ferredoxin [Salinisphaeraceae bacterium]
MSDWKDVCPANDLKNGQCKLVELDDDLIAVYRINDDFHAIEDRCTHDGGELATGEVEGDQVICPRHGARFCIRTGEALTPPAYEDVDTFPLRVENGRLQIRDHRDDH